MSVIVVLYAQDYAELTWKQLADFENLGLANIVSCDVDQDGRDEFIYSSTDGKRSTWKIIDHSNDGYQVLYTSDILRFEINWIECFVSQDGSSPYLYYSTDENTILQFNLITKQVDQELSFDFEIEQFKLIDLDSNDIPELITSANDSIFIYDENMQLLHNRPAAKVKDLAVGNVDGDPNMELVISAKTGVVVDLLTYDTDWTYAGGFGTQVELADPEDNGYAWIYSGTSSSMVVAYSAADKAKLWEFAINFPASDLLVTDLEDDGAYEIIIGIDAFNRGLKCYAEMDQTLLWDTTTVQGGVSMMCSSDLDGDGIKEIMYGSGEHSTAQDVCVVLNANSRVNEWVSKGSTRGYVFDFGHFNDDTIPDIAILDRFQEGLESGPYASVLQVATKVLIEGEIHPPTFSHGEDISIVRQNGVPYVLCVSQRHISIYNGSTKAFAFEEDLGIESMNFGGFYELEGYSDPMAILCFQDGHVELQRLQSGTLIDVWASDPAGQYVRDYKVGDFDYDGFEELAFLSGNEVIVYDLITFEEEEVFDLGVPALMAFDIADMDRDGVMELIYQPDSDVLEFIDFETKVPGNITIPDLSISAFTVANIDKDPEPEIATVSEEWMVVLDNNGDELFRSFVAPDPNGEVEHLEWKDVDADMHMELYAGTTFGVFEFTLDGEYVDFEQPFVKSAIPPDSSRFMSTNTSFKFIFSEKLDASTLDDNVHVVSNGTDTIPATIDYQSGKREVVVAPQGVWPSNAELSVMLIAAIADLDGNPLDGNRNRIPDAMGDDYSLTIWTGGGEDLTGPQVREIEGPSEVYRSIPLEISGVAADTFSTSRSVIESIEYAIDDDPMAGHSMSIEPTDMVFDNMVEGFAIKINTDTLTKGMHTIRFIATDALGNKGEVAGFDFTVKVDSPDNWSVYGRDLKNTCYNGHATTQAPFVPRYDIFHANASSQSEITKAIVADDYLIYGVAERLGSNQIVSVDLHTGEHRWSHDLDIQDRIYPPAYAYGRVFAQLGGHSESELVCYDLVSGEEIWNTPYSTQWMDAYGPVVHRDKVYIVEGYFSTTLGAYDVLSGERQWVSDIHKDNNYDLWLPAFYNDTIYAYAENFNAIDPGSGGILYSYSDDDIPFDWPGWSMRSTVIIDTTNRNALLTSSDYVHAVSLDDHSIQWTIEPTSGQISSPAALADGKLYFRSNRYLNEYDVKTGALLWQVEVGSGSLFHFAPAVNDSLLVFSTEDQTLILSRETKEIRAILPFGGDVVLHSDYLIVSRTDEPRLMVYQYDPDQVPLSGELMVRKPITCHGDSDGELVANVEGGLNDYSYEWSEWPSPDSKFLTGLDTGHYAVTITDGGVNVLFLSTELSQPEPMEVATNQVPATNGQSNGQAEVVVSGGIDPYMYSWEGYPQVTASVLQNIPGGNYSVTVTDDNGCSATANITVKGSTSIHNLVDDNILRVFPTITSGAVHLEFSAPVDEISIRVFDSSGRNLRAGKVKSVQRHEISLMNLPGGTYFVHINHAEWNVVQKVVLR